MMIDLSAAYERSCERDEDAKEAAADAAEHFGIEAHKQLRGQFLAAVMSDVAAPLDIHGWKYAEAVGDVIAGDFADELAYECLRIITSAARGLAAVDPHDLQRRADAWLGKMADTYADRHQEALAVELERAAEDEAEDLRTDARIDDYEMRRAA